MIKYIIPLILGLTNCATHERVQLDYWTAEEHTRLLYAARKACNGRIYSYDASTGKVLCATYTDNK